MLSSHCSGNYDFTLTGIEDEDIYIDSVGVFSNDWDHHVQLLANISLCLHEKGFTINPLKCEWAIKKTDWLVYWLTPAGLKPWKKKKRLSCTWIVPAMPLSYECSLDELISTMTCGQVDLS